MSRLVTAYQSSLVGLDVCGFWSGLELRRLRITGSTKLTPEKICTIHTHTLSLSLPLSLSPPPSLGTYAGDQLRAVPDGRRR